MTLQEFSTHTRIVVDSGASYQVTDNLPNKSITIKFSDPDANIDQSTPTCQDCPIQNIQVDKEGTSYSITINFKSSNVEYFDYNPKGQKKLYLDIWRKAVLTEEKPKVVPKVVQPKKEEKEADKPKSKVFHRENITKDYLWSMYPYSDTPEFFERRVEKESFVYFPRSEGKDERDAHYNLVVDLLDQKKFALAYRTIKFYEEKYKEFPQGNLFKSFIMVNMAEELNELSYYEAAEFYLLRSQEHKSPLSIDIRLALGRGFLRNKNEVTALRYLNEALATTKQLKGYESLERKILYEMGEVSYSLKKYQEAIGQFKKVAFLNCHETSCAQAAYRIGDAFIKEGRYNDAMSSYQLAQKLYPWFSFPINSSLRRIDIGFYNYYFDESMGLIENFLKEHEAHISSAFALKRQAEIYLLKDEKDKAIETLKLSELKYPKSQASYEINALLTILEWTKKTEREKTSIYKDFIENLIKSPDNEKRDIALVVAMRLAMNQLRYYDAFKIFEGNLYYIKPRKVYKLLNVDYKVAKSAMLSRLSGEPCVKESKKFLLDDDITYTRYRLSQCLYSLGRYSEALDQVVTVDISKQRSTERKISPQELNLLKAKILFANNEYSQSRAQIKLFQEEELEFAYNSLLVDPNFTWAYSIMEDSSKIPSSLLPDFKEKVLNLMLQKEAFTDIIKLEPDTSVYKGIAYAKINQCDKALPILDSQLTDSIGNGVIETGRFFQAQCYLGLGKNEKALDTLSKLAEKATDPVIKERASGILKYETWGRKVTPDLTKEQPQGLGLKDKEVPWK